MRKQSLECIQTHRFYSNDNRRRRRCTAQYQISTAFLFLSPGAPSLSDLCQRVCASTVFMSELPGLMSLFPSSPGAPTLSGFCLRLCTSMLFMYSAPSLRSPPKSHTLCLKLRCRSQIKKLRLMGVSQVSPDSNRDIASFRSCKQAR